MSVPKEISQIKIISVLMFASPLYVFSSFLVRKNPEHFSDEMFAFAFPLVFFAFPYIAARLTGDFRFHAVASVTLMVLASCADVAYFNYNSISLRMSLWEVITAIMVILVTTFSGVALGWLHFRNALTPNDNSVGQSEEKTR